MQNILGECLWLWCWMGAQLWPVAAEPTNGKPQKAVSAARGCLGRGLGMWAGSEKENGLVPCVRAVPT